MVLLNNDDGVTLGWGDVGRGSFGVAPRRSAVLPPLDFKLQREGNGLRPFVIERARFISATQVSAATKYLIWWTNEMDAATVAGREAGMRRAVSIGTIDRTFVGDQKLYGPLLTDAQFSSGYFLCVGTNDEGDQSRILVASPQTGSILDSGIPANVTDLQISESGDAHQDTIHSAISFTYVAPRPKRSFSGIVPVIDDYPNVGDRTFFSKLSYDGVSGGAGGGLLRIPQCRRYGNGTISIAGANVNGIGTTFTQFAKVDDQIEIFGRRARILTVTDALIVLTAAWTGPAVAGETNYVVIGKCRIFALAVSQTGTFVLNDSTPFKDVDIDGELSAPNAPAALTLVPYGGGIRGQFVQVSGVRIKHYIVKRSTGSSDTPTTATEIVPPVVHDPTTATGGTVLQFDDTKFTVYEREQGQVFRYYVWTVNARDEISASYATATGSCRLSSPGEGSPPNTGREVALNQFWNGHINGTVANPVAVGDVSQDVNMGGAPPAGRSRWYGVTAGVGVAPGHVSSTEVVLAHSVLGSAGTSALQQDVDGWDNAAAANRRLPTNRPLCVQVKVRTSGGTPSGTLVIDVLQFNGAVQTGTAMYRQRISDDSIDESAFWLEIAGSDIVTDYQLVWGVFVPDPAAVTTHFTVRIYYQVTAWNGVNVFATEAMFAIAETLPPYIPQMADPAITYTRPSGGAPTPRSSFDPDDGHGGPHIVFP